MTVFTIGFMSNLASNTKTPCESSMTDNAHDVFLFRPYQSVYTPLLCLWWQTRVRVRCIRFRQSRMRKRWKGETTVNGVETKSRSGISSSGKKSRCKKKKITPLWNRLLFCHSPSLWLSHSLSLVWHTRRPCVYTISGKITMPKKQFV